MFKKLRWKKNQNKDENSFIKMFMTKYESKFHKLDESGRYLIKISPEEFQAKLKPIFDKYKALIEYKYLGKTNNVSNNIWVVISIKLIS